MNIRRVLGAGIVARIVMGMVEMIYEAVGGRILVARGVHRRDRAPELAVRPDPCPVHGYGCHPRADGPHDELSDLGAHLRVSRFPISRGALVGGRVVYALAVFVVMWFLVVPAIDPVMLKLNGMMFAIAHMMWGAAPGLIVPLPSGSTARVGAT